MVYSDVDQGQAIGSRRQRCPIGKCSVSRICLDLKQVRGQGPSFSYMVEPSGNRLGVLLVAAAEGGHPVEAIDNDKRREEQYAVLEALSADRDDTTPNQRGSCPTARCSTGSRPGA